MKRFARLAVGSFVLVAAAVVLSPHAFNFVSRSAIVNAPVISIKSPFEGLLMSRPRRPGEPISPGIPVVEISASMGTTVEVARLTAHARALGQERGAILDELSSLERLDGDLKDRMRMVTTLTGDVLRLRRDGLLSRQRAAQDRARSLEAEADRVEQLARSGAVSTAHLERTASDARAAREEIGALDAELSQIALELQAIEQGTMTTVGMEDGSYAQQRRDEVAIRLADLRTRAAVLSAQIDSMHDQIRVMRSELLRLEHFAPQFDNGAVVWTASPAAGSAVATGDEVLQVLDCSRRFLEVTIPESAYSKIAIGARAWVRLNGADQVFWAEVESLRGAGSQPETGRLAARPEEVEQGSLSVMLLLEPVEVTSPDVAQRYCEVGRTAEVRFDRGWEGPLRTRIAAFMDLFRNTWQTALLKTGLRGREPVR